MPVKRKASERKSIYVCIRVSKADLQIIDQARKKVKIKKLTFIRDSAVNKARQIVKGE
jgi:uncharacterized protein (DUF1778 family)